MNASLLKNSNDKRNGRNPALCFPTGRKKNRRNYLRLVEISVCERVNLQTDNCKIGRVIDFRNIIESSLSTRLKKKMCTRTYEYIFFFFWLCSLFSG